MPLVVLGLSHHSSPVTVRERFAFAEARRAGGAADRSATRAWPTRRSFFPPATAWRFTPSPNWSRPQAFAALRDFLVTCHEYRDPLTDEIYTLSEPQSLYHLFKVACGLDSMVLGETEILGQLKKAYDLALQGGHTGGRLNKAFQRAFNVAKHIRTETNIQRGSVSVGSVAVELAEKIFRPAERPRRHDHRRGRHQREDRARPALARRPQHPRLEPFAREGRRPGQ